MNTINLKRETKNYSEVFDVAEYLADTELGSVSNAIMVMVRRSDLYQSVTASQHFADWKKNQDRAAR